MPQLTVTITQEFSDFSCRCHCVIGKPLLTQLRDMFPPFPTGGKAGEAEKGGSKRSQESSCHTEGQQN